MSRYNDNRYTELEYHEEDKIRELLLGQKIKKVSENTLELDNGTILEIEPNDGCGGCPSGHYELEELNEVDNVITAVEFEDIEDFSDPHADTQIYQIFVLAESQKIKILDVRGDDGNGYYGSGYRIWVKKPMKFGKGYIIPGDVVRLNRNTLSLPEFHMWFRGEYIVKEVFDDETCYIRGMGYVDIRFTSSQGVVAWEHLEKVGK